MPLTKNTRAVEILTQALMDGATWHDAKQAYELAVEGIEPLPADEDYQPTYKDTNDVY